LQQEFIGTQQLVKPIVSRLSPHMDPFQLLQSIMESPAKTNVFAGDNLNHKLKMYPEVFMHHPESGYKIDLVCILV
jgi:hypothetical protein